MIGLYITASVVWIIMATLSYYLGYRAGVVKVTLRILETQLGKEGYKTWTGEEK